MPHGSFGALHVRTTRSENASVAPALAAQEDAPPTPTSSRPYVCPPSSCLRRTKALEEDGVLAGYRADPGRKRLGLGLTVFLSLKVEYSRTNSQVVEEALKGIDHVVTCHVVSGDADFIVELAVPDLRTFEKVLVEAPGSPSLPPGLVDARGE
ncbi:Lrp/AsnC family transcriptional regulator [Streptomyces sp. uw30]|uniref:Lrp/AsnC family transcriptional regulator n=1 Tax=Streptomyces sp. uw30 TaxID=1828179 RepID=UPI0021C97F2B|nr:Lrp/AsnC family transcriptional regulator [Streptomyces sp. uw30]